MVDFVPFAKLDLKQWDDFCLNSKSAWFRHSSHAIRFCLSLNDSSENLSFGILEGGKLLAVIPLIKQPISGEDNIFEFAMGGDPMPFPATLNDLSETKAAKLIKSAFERAEGLAKENSVAYVKFFSDPLTDDSEDGPGKFNQFLKSGFSDVSLTTNVVDLSLSEEELFKNIRDGYQYDIRSAGKMNLSVDFFDKNNISEQIFRAYKDIYFSAAGKEVGTKNRWDATYELIRGGNAILALEKDSSGKFISGVVFFAYKQAAYYAFGATAADFKEINGISHFLQWEIIKHLKANGFRYYELGCNFYPIISDEVRTPKEISISFFKSGFGGSIKPLFRGEKFYNAEYFKKRKVQMIEKYIENYMSQIK